MRRTEMVNHTYRVRLKNKDLLNTLINIETGQRGYLIMNKEAFLKPYADSRIELKTVQRSLRLLARDNVFQNARIDTLDVLINKKLSVVETAIARVKAGRPIDTLAIEEGHAYMEEIRNISRRFDNEERRLLTQRSNLQKMADRNSTIYLLLLSIISTAFLLLFFRLLYIELHRRIKYQTTLEQKLNELENANIELEQFAYVASHDLQEPLRKIQAFGERLRLRQGTQLNEEGKTNLLKISESAARMQQLIDDLLVFSRTANLRDRAFEEIDLNEVLIETREELSEVILEKKAEIISDLLPVVKGIHFQLVQLFINLVSNALKYSKTEESPLIEITYSQAKGRDIQGVGESQHENIFHCISFIDNGIGFDAQYAEKIFVIFQRLHGRTEYQGTGIGLALCRRIMTNHQGYIFAEPRTETTGSIFHVYLPK
ncbi:MAG: CHASE3 domain-containing protein [Spirosomataceae bacterium]